MPSTDSAASEKDIVFVVDPERVLCDAIRDICEEAGYAVRSFSDCSAFLESYKPGGRDCLLIDASALEKSGIELIERLSAEGTPTVVTSAGATLPIALHVMRAGAFDLIEKPIHDDELLVCVKRAFSSTRDASELSAFRRSANRRVAGLTGRQHQIMDMVLAGHPSKNIAVDLGISQRTVENHRAAIAKRTGARSLPAMIHTALCANCSLNNSIRH